MNLYKSLVRPLFFQLDPENAHHLVLRSLPVLRAIGAVAALRALVGSVREAPVVVSGMRFENRIGLAAGFDKEALAVDLFGAMGFGHIELGTITPRPQPGNPRPRIFRFPKDEALINRMGFPSSGAEVVAARLQKLRAQNRRMPILGINVGKCKDTTIDDALQDYVYSCRALSQYADYVAVNVSSPNTQDLRQLQQRERLVELLTGIKAAVPVGKPIFVKVAPDLSNAELDDVVFAAERVAIAGIIATNTTITRVGLTTTTTEPGGMSGRPLRERSLEVVRHLCAAVGNRLAIIGVGGVSDAQSAYAMLESGASLVQVYSSVIYEGPGVVKGIVRGLARLQGE